MKTLKTKTSAKVLILGIGNVLMGDEGIGVVIIVSVINIRANAVVSASGTCEQARGAQV